MTELPAFVNLGIEDCISANILVDMSLTVAIMFPWSPFTPFANPSLVYIPRLSNSLEGEWMPRKLFNPSRAFLPRFSTESTTLLTPAVIPPTIPSIMAPAKLPIASPRMGVFSRMASAKPLMKSMIILNPASIILGVSCPIAVRNATTTSTAD